MTRRTLTGAGIDVSTSLIVLAGLDEHGDISHCCLALDTTLRGAHRFAAAREVMFSVPQLNVDAVIVEIPWAGNSSSFALLGLAAIAAEAIQVCNPGAIVMDVPTSTWKLESVGHGNATKGEVMDHAKGLGYTGDSQDVADALCMAQVALNRLIDKIGPSR